VDRLGIGAAALRARYPDLVYVSISSFGQFGPLSPRASHDLSSQGMAGFVTGEVPAPAPLPLADLASALYTVVGVVSSLFARGRGAGGAQIDVSMLDALIALRSTSLVSTLNGLDPAPYPPLDPGYGVFRFSGGRLMTLSIAGEDHQWRALCDVLGLPDLADLDTAAREADAERLRAALQDRIDRIDPDTLEQALEARGVGFGPVYDDHEVADDPHVRARRMVVTVEDDSKLRVVRQPLVFDGEPGSVARGVPALGQHSTEVLREAGLDDESIQSLMARGVVTSNERSNS
jgi:crotonobetainyl-CoA:carnitine CoA-transferase CaiB-like acyl-CoA transferase